MNFDQIPAGKNPPEDILLPSRSRLTLPHQV